jgi:hypothetical protein
MRRYGYLFGLLLLIAGIASAFGYYYNIAASQIRVSVGDRFPPIRVEGLNVNKRQCVIVMKNGCAYCQMLKANLDTLFFEKPDWREKTTFIAIDEPPIDHERNYLIFHSKENEANFAVTPQMFFLNEQGIVLRKHLGVVATVMLKKDFETYLEVGQVKAP